MLTNTHFASSVITTALSGSGYFAATQDKQDVEINLFFFFAWDAGRETLNTAMAVPGYSRDKIQKLNIFH